MSLVGHGSQSGIRIIFIWQLVISTLTFVEVYFNGDKSDEDRERLKEFLKKLVE